MPPREVEQPGQDQWGADVHPGFGMIGASRIQSTPGAVLFDSDVRHQNTIVVRIKRASRKRDLKSDYLHATSSDIVEIEMSEAQWASFVSTMNSGDGVPCTIRRTEKDGAMAGLEYAPRLALSMQEVHQAAVDTFAEIKAARDALAELKARVPKAKAAEVRDAERHLHYAIENATANVDFTSKQLAKHAENVVQKARADIEAVVTRKAAQLGIDAGDASTYLELGTGDE